MNRKNNISDLVNILFSFLLTLSFVLNFLNSMGISSLFFEILFVNLILAIFLHYIFIYIHSIKTIIFLYLFSFIMILLLFYFFILNNISILDFIRTIFVNRDNLKYAEILFLMVILSFIISFISYYICNYGFRFYLIILTGVLIFLIQVFLSIQTSEPSFFIYMFVVILAFIKQGYFRKSLEENTSKNEIMEESRFIFHSLPFVFIIFFTIIIFPSGSKALDFPVIFGKPSTGLHSLSQAWITLTGFNENEELGGKLSLNDNTVLHVKADSPDYLRASVSNYYNGRRWERWFHDEGDETRNENNFEIIETILGSLLLSLEEKQSSFGDLLDILQFQKMDIEYFFDNQQILFSPLKTINFINFKNNVLFHEEIYKISDRNVDIKKYSLRSLNIKYNNEKLISLLKKSHKGLYNSLEEFDIPVYFYFLYLVLNLNDSDLSVLDSSFEPINTIFEDLSNELMKDRNLRNMKITDFIKWLGNSWPHNKEIDNFPSSNAYLLSILQNNSQIAHESYMELPESLPLRVKEKALDITKDYNTNYDKIKALETYLSENYTYTLSPDTLPDAADFVDHFLFESKQGYCTYFSTAMAVLCRAIGVPSRYVRGYSYPFSALLNTNYKVSNMEAHAWVEIYLEGFGWLPFEPTSGFTGAYYEDEEYTGNFNSDFLEEMRDSDYLKNFINYNENLEQAEKNEQKNKRFLFIFIFRLSLILLVISLLLIMGIALFNHLRWNRKFINYMKMDRKEAIIHFYKYFLLVFSYMNLKVKPGETAREFAGRIDSQKKSFYISFLNITEIFMISRYSQQPIKSGDIEKIASFKEDILRLLKKELPFFKYFLLKHILSRF